jgi:hypothetical protein
MDEDTMFSRANQRYSSADDEVGVLLKLVQTRAA